MSDGLIGRFRELNTSGSFSEKVGQHFTGTREPPKLTLRYTLESKRIVEVEGQKQPEKILNFSKSGLVEFYLTSSDNCRRQQNDEGHQRTEEKGEAD